MYEVFINGKKKEASKIVTLVGRSTVENIRRVDDVAFVSKAFDVAVRSGGIWLQGELWLRITIGEPTA